MSQVFSGDSVNAGTVSIPTTTETTVVTGNFLNPPFGNAKAVVSGQCILTVGTSCNSVLVRIRRNPNAENVQVAFGQTTNVAGAQIIFVNVQGADVIPDGRPVQYALTVQQGAATANGSVNPSNITTFLISG